ncbi:MAG: type II toxin-antitoxin system RatA family toxin [Steroidobacteraceae bacterium]
MREVKRSALIAASPARLFGLINDVERYPEFLPWCTSSEVKQRDEGQIVATLGVRKGLLRMHFTTRNVLTADRSIRMELVDGPFRSLQGLWTLTPIAAPGEEPGAVAGCRVDLELRFEFAGAFGGAMLEPVFEAMATSLFDAFLARARSTS